MGQSRLNGKHWDLCPPSEYNFSPEPVWQENLANPKWLLSARFCCWGWRLSAAGVWSWWTRAWRSPGVDRCSSQRRSWRSTWIRLRTVRWRWWWTNPSLREWEGWLHRWGHTCCCSYRLMNEQNQNSCMTGVWFCGVCRCLTAAS